MTTQSTLEDLSSWWALPCVWQEDNRWQGVHMEQHSSQGWKVGSVPPSIHTPSHWPDSRAQTKQDAPLGPQSLVQSRLHEHVHVWWPAPVSSDTSPGLCNPQPDVPAGAQHSQGEHHGCSSNRALRSWTHPGLPTRGQACAGSCLPVLSTGSGDQGQACGRGAVVPLPPRLVAPWLKKALTKEVTEVT